MGTSTGTGLAEALLQIRQAAEKLKAYDAGQADQLAAVVRANAGMVGDTARWPADRAAQRERIVAQCRAVTDCVERARKYPEMIAARADVLDRSGMLARMIRDLDGKTGGQR